MDATVELNKADYIKNIDILFDPQHYRKLNKNSTTKIELQTEKSIIVKI